MVDKNDSVIVLDGAENRECDRLNITKDNQGVNVQKDPEPRQNPPGQYYMNSDPPND